MSHESSTNNSSCERFSQSQPSTPNSKSIETSSIFKGSIRRFNHDQLSKEIYQFPVKEAKTTISSQPETKINHGSLKERVSPSKSSNKVFNSPVKVKQNTQNEAPIKSFKARGGGFRRESKYYGDYKDCTNYLRYGYCRFGDTCKYVHPDFDEFTESEASEEEEPGLDSPVTPVSNPKQNFDFKRTELCRFFKRSGSCYKGNNCNFSHVFPYQKTTVESLQEPFHFEGASTSKNLQRVDHSDETSKNVSKDAPICRNYMFYGKCRFGDTCKFSHVPRTTKNATNKSNNNEDKEKGATMKKEEELLDLNNSEDVVTTKTIEITTLKIKSNLHLSKRNVVKPLKANLYIPELSVDDIHNLRKDEIAYLKRKFQRKIENEKETEMDVYFNPTDPDWKFEVKQVKLRLSIPDDYPKEMCSIQCLNDDDVLPLILLRHLNKIIVDWLTERFRIATRNEKVELVFRPFFKWLDQNLEDMFIEGLKKVRRNIVAEAAGIQFIPHEDIVEDLKQNWENVEEAETIEQPVPEVQPEPKSELQPKEKIRTGIPSSTPRIGTEIKLRSLELTENAATLSCRKLALTIQCGRCRLRSDIITPPLRINKIVCSRCNHTQQVTFRPQLLHQFMAVLGYLDLDDCQVVDLPLSKCDFSIGCLNCNRQADMNGLQYGQKQHTWCFYCNSKMAIRIESMKFQYMRVGPINVGATQVVKLGKRVKNVHDPAIQEGKPLPDNGTCKHYKKSFRWLRFPCCGKAYPCDFCHDDKETDHEMKLANRMLCGFCAKEQPYTNGKDCILCSSSLNKRTGTHWEGGRGCRDKIKMSREDKQKYQGTNKTQSKKAQLAQQN